MITQDDLIKTDPGDPNSIRYDRIAKKYEELSARLAQQAAIDEEKHTKMLQEFEIVNKRILDSASNLARKPQEAQEAQEPNTNTDITDRASRRRAKQSQQELYANNRYWLATKRGL